METILTYTIIATFIIVVAIFLVVKYRNKNMELQHTKNDNCHIIDLLNAKIAQLDSNIKTESERCATANKENTSSIRYAQRIQRAAFPQKEIGNVFDDYFIFTKSIDIVTGDFFKAVKVKNYKIFVLADCAGHGIPGAFLTMLGLSALKESLTKHFNDSNINLAEILGEMRQFVKTSLKSNNNQSNIHDGMNLTLCAFDTNGEIRFAGANQNVYLYSNGILQAFNGDRMPIGWSFKNENPFTQTIIQAPKGSMLYLTTDSLQSQFGGPNNVKFSTKRLTAMFKDIAPLPIQEQQKNVSSIVNNWVEGYTQVDDLTVAGVRV